MAGTSGCVVCKVASVLVTLGAINWGLVGLFQLDLVAQLLGGTLSGPARAVYTLIGIAGVLTIIGCWFKMCPCQKGACGTKS